MNRDIPSGFRLLGSYHGGFSFASPVPSGVLHFGDEALDMEQHTPLPRKRTPPPGRVIFELRARAISSVEITSEQIAKSKVGAVLLFGVLGLAAKDAQDRTVIVVHMKSGETGYFRLLGFSVSTMLGAVTPWLHQHSIPIGARAAPTNASVSIADELKKLAELRDAGVLTDEEFAPQKAKLLA